MKTLYLECSLGVSGDMLLAALSDMLEDGQRILTEAVQALGLPGVSLRFTEQMVQGIRTSRVEVLEESPQPLRHLQDLTRIVRAAALPERVKDGAIEALTRLALAEAKVHNEPLEEIHFHEVGAVDTVVDVLGAVLLVEASEADQVIASAVNLGSGFVEFSHGRFPVPAPACAELALGMRTFATPSGVELATPTGLCLVKTLAASYGPLPLGSILSLGYGSGTYSTGPYPTFLRAYLLETEENAEADEAQSPAQQEREDSGNAYYGPHGHNGVLHGQGRHTHGKPGHEDSHEDSHENGHRHQGRHGHDHDRA